jgi:hypothetical protein
MNPDYIKEMEFTLSFVDEDISRIFKVEQGFIPSSVVLFQISKDLRTIAKKLGDCKNCPHYSCNGKDNI